MTVHHEDRVFWGVISTATLIALFLAIAVFTTPWTIAGQCFAFAFVILAWAGAAVPVTIFYFEERDTRLRKELHSREEEEKRRLERAQLQETNGS